MKICVVGTGYVGLVTGACLADFGHHVIGVDIDEDKIARLKEGEIPIFEPGLDELVGRGSREGRLEFTTDLGPAVQDSAAVFIAVGTPPQADGRADLVYVRQVARSIGEHLNGYKAIITKSTVPTGTGKIVHDLVAEASGGKHDFAVVSNPEFLREGSAIEDFRYPDRVVIGSHDPKAIELMHDVYAPLKRAKVPFLDTNVETAEMIKYASNGFLATKISFINEMAALCDAYGANVEMVARGMGLDDRIGPRFLHPGPGFGGSCFPKDTRAVSQIAQDRGLTFRIIDAVLDANTRTQERMIEKVKKTLGGDLEGKKLGVLGLAFKGNTDDVRETPALPILRALVDAGAEIRAYDPQAIEEFQKEFDREIAYGKDEYEVAEGADALLILTDWNQFRALELDRMRQLLAEPLIIDLRNLYQSADVSKHGLRYVSVGRPDALPGNDADSSRASS